MLHPFKTDRTERHNKWGEFWYREEPKLSEGFWPFAHCTMTNKKTVQLLQPETKRKILEAWSKEFKAAGLPTVEEARKEMETLLRKPEHYEPHEFAMSGFVSGSSWTPLAVIDRAISEWPEPTPEELEDILKRIDGFRFEIKPIFDEAAKKLSKSLLRRLGGRPLVIELDEHPKICNEVLALYKMRVPLGIAFKRIAKRHNVSAKSIQRIWQGRPKDATTKG